MAVDNKKYTKNSTRKGTSMENNSAKIKQLAEMIENLGKPVSIPVLNNNLVPVRTPATSGAVTPSDQIRTYRAFVESLNANTAYFVAGEQILREFMESPLEDVVEEEVMDEQILNESSSLFNILTEPGERTPGGKLISKPKFLPGGKPMLHYLHKYEGLSDATEWDYVPNKSRVQNMMFKKNADNVMIIIGQNGVAFAKPDKDYMDAKTQAYSAQGKSYDATRDTNLLYKVVAFQKDQRVDNMLITDEFEMEDVYNPKTGKYVKKVKRDPSTGKPIVLVDRSAERKRGKLAPNATPTRIVPRVGTPYEKDRQNPEGAFFDNLRAGDVIGAIKKVYIGTSHLAKSREFSPKSWMKKDFKPAPIPQPTQVYDPIEKKKVSVGHIASVKQDIPGAMRLPGAVARGIKTGRAELRNIRPQTADVVAALHPAMEKLLPKALDKLRSEISAAQSANKEDEAQRLSRTAQDVQSAIDALNDQNTTYDHPALADLGRVIEKTVMSYTGGDKDALDNALAALASKREGLPEFWRAFMSNLTDPDIWA
jgi:hypothetical protein